MSAKHELKSFLEHTAYNMRVSSLAMTTRAGSGHPTSCLSAADLMAGLFFYAMRFDPHHFLNPNNDRFILSKGHASPLFYAAWKEVGILTDEDLAGYRDFDSALEGHPTLRFPYTEAATGSLGTGLSIGVGMALTAKLDNRDFVTYVMLGDSEVAEGSIWEAAELAAYNDLDNLVAVLDCNRLGQRGETMHGHHVDRYEQKFEAFGWRVITIDGHDMNEIMHALDKASESHEHPQPTIIIAKTIKGYGVELFANKNGYHGKALNDETLDEALVELERTFPEAANYAGTYQWHPVEIEQADAPARGCVFDELGDPIYKHGDMIATRKAYGAALTALGRVCDSVVCLDAEVSNSTFAYLFQERFPKRFFECFIAEQNMVSMGIGFERRGKVPFISTFGAFMSRAHDQIRMASISSSALRLVGSHAGVSIGQDGPSQMALEDIALFRALPDSIVLYPSDAISTQKLVGLMAQYNQGVSYLRTTRMATPVRYAPFDEFELGGCKVLHESDDDVACIVAAGVTLVEAVKAYEQLAEQGISVSVIDLYSVKPLDVVTLQRVGAKSGNRIITVEDHYLEGGLGSAVLYALRDTEIKTECLAVTELPRSGMPEELLAWASIDAQAIVKAVMRA